VLALLVALAACGSDPGRAVDPAGDPEPTPPTSAPVDAGIPPADGEVASRTLATVLDAGDAGGPELCLGPVAESYPPQCRGIPLRGWDWSQRQGQYDESGGVRWGRFVVRGGDLAVLEGDWHPSRLVMLEFEDLEAAKRWYESEVYQEAKKLREGAAHLRMVAVQGVSS